MPILQKNLELNKALVINDSLRPLAYNDEYIDDRDENRSDQGGPRRTKPGPKTRSSTRV